MLTMLRGALTRFLLQEDHVEDGGDDGGRGLAWGGLYRWRRRRQGRARVSIWGKIRTEEGKWRTPASFIGPPECAGGQNRRR